MRGLMGIVLGVVITASMLSGGSVIYRSEDAKRGYGDRIYVGPDQPVYSAH